MFKVFLILAAGLFAQWLVNTDYIQSIVAISYPLCLLSIATIYTTAAIVSLYISRNAKPFPRLLAYLLISCMLISSMFNIVMMSPTMYYLLVDIKQNHALSWKNIYLTVEIAVLLIVGKHGIDFIARSLGGFYNRFCVTISSSLNYIKSVRQT